MSKSKAEAKKSGEGQQFTVVDKLVSLAKLQIIDSKIDKIHTIRGELPLEVQDLEDELQGLETRIEKYKAQIDEKEAGIAGKKNAIKESEKLIAKYEEQRNNVRNNREYDSLTKEIDYQGLEIELSEKHIREFKESIEGLEKLVADNQEKLEERQKDLDSKKQELKEIISENEKEEKDLLKKSEESKKKIDDRLLGAYSRIRNGSKNGLVIVPVERDACGGCFNKIPPQRQLDIKMYKKIIVCEYCGRILVDDNIFDKANDEL